nr:YeeE/YedE family protein [Gemmatimonadota bacterium]NIQ59580.1 YeeE/YedE family protein [Gemmatimonadota bacterium]NIU79789.1 YeeE/YedE family protein [Gammaproteobacteria bacterium]NIX48294.1 YeeE/YedE family protein [Gemmatimonadota bacterium]NIY12739.1 YeeE/YedE family protein [Gemmatimonadota bacterium]
MRAPFYELGAFGEGASLAVALLIGLGFGWFLERGGLGNARKLAAQFYLTDLTVFKMLFTAVVTAMLGLFWLTRAGLVEPALVYVPPTWVVPQLLGGLVFGVGFVMGGLCPGTSCVAVSSGRTDGFAVLAGMLFGIFAFGEAFPVLEPLYDATPAGTLTLHGLLGIPYPVAVLGMTLLAVAAFRGAEAIERRASRRLRAPGLRSSREPGPEA